MDVGDKARLKSGEGPLMTVKSITAAGYHVCYWYEPSSMYHERMFLPEMLVRQESATPRRFPE